MKTKTQKIQAVEEGMEAIKKSETLIFADFSGVSVEELKRLRRALREIGAKFSVMKKRLMRVMFEKLGLDFNPEKFEAQVGTVLSLKGISDVAGVVYKFSRETVGANKKERFAILGAYDMSAKKFMEDSEVKMIGQLPSREVLLGQLLGTIAGPMRAFLYVLNKKSKK
ncbi:MAG TPA: 50S ribosomal protein L10 [Candidatus Paceibacterota bacterium]